MTAEAKAIQMADGNWLATSPDGAPVPIGVFGDTEDGAREALAARVLERETKRVEWEAAGLA